MAQFVVSGVAQFVVSVSCVDQFVVSGEWCGSVCGELCGSVCGEW